MPIDDCGTQLEYIDRAHRLGSSPHNMRTGTRSLQSHAQIKRDQRLLLDDEDRLTFETAASHVRFPLRAHTYAQA